MSIFVKYERRPQLVDWLLVGFFPLCIMAYHFPRTGRSQPSLYLFSALYYVFCIFYSSLVSSIGSKMVLKELIALRVMNEEAWKEIDRLRSSLLSLDLEMYSWVPGISSSVTWILFDFLCIYIGVSTLLDARRQFKNENRQILAGCAAYSRLKIETLKLNFFVVFLCPMMVVANVCTSRWHFFILAIIQKLCINNFFGYWLGRRYIKALLERVDSNAFPKITAAEKGALQSSMERLGDKFHCTIGVYLVLILAVIFLNVKRKSSVK